MKSAMTAAIAASILATAGCDVPKQSADAGQTTTTSQGKVYSLDDVNHELRDGGVQPESSQDVAREFFKEHPAYTVCKDFDGGMIAVVRNKKVDAKADDQYIVIAYREGKLNSLEIGPPQFSVGNVASYCQ
jgi:hypothetical protein